jgi:hypothetical protein
MEEDTSEINISCPWFKSIEGILRQCFGRTVRIDPGREVAFLPDGSERMLCVVAGK